MSLVACSQNTIDEVVDHHDDEQMIVGDGALRFVAAEEGDDLDIFDDYFGSNNASRAGVSSDQGERVVASYEVAEGVTMTITAKPMNSKSVATRAERRSTFITESKLSVFGYHSESSAWIFDNQELENSTGSFQYSPLKFWPSTGGIQFFGAYPYFSTTDQIQLTSTAGAAGCPPVVKFESSTNSFEQTDFMTATTDVRTSEGGTVPLNFKHRLSRFIFEVHNSYMSNDVIIKYITIGDATNGVMCSANGSYTTADSYTITNGDGSHNTDGFEWGAMSNSQIITARNADGTSEQVPPFLNIANAMETNALIEDYRLDEDWEVTLLPQTLTAVPVKVSYVVSGAETDEKTLELTLDNFTFEQSYEYTFKFTMKDPDSYVDVDEDGNLVIDAALVPESTADGAPIPAVDDVMEKLAELGYNSVKVINPSPTNDAIFKMLRHIVAANTMEHYDLSEFTVPPGAKFNDGNMFFNNTVIKTMKLPVLDDSQFADNTFQNCTALESVTFHEESTFTILPISTFNGCTSLKEVVNLKDMPVVEIQQSAFQNCNNLPEVKLPSSVTLIGASVFENCTSLSKINIPASLIANPPKLPNLTNPGQYIEVFSIGYHAFVNCSSLYSYEQNGVESGVIFEDRGSADPITLGWNCFNGSHVRYADFPANYVSNSGNGYFSDLK